MNACPESSAWEELISGKADDGSAESLRNHLEDCPACRAVLDRLTEDDELARWASSALGEFAYAGERGFGELLRRERGVEKVAEADASTFDMRLDAFLQSPEHPGELGRLGSYIIEAELGRGGMGIVLLARDSVLRRATAIKVLRTELPTGDLRGRLIREARAAARFRHEHAAAVYAVEETPEGRPFIVMEYVAGPSLSELIRRRGRIAPKAAAELCRQIASALSAAHAASLVHRDVKPANILLDVECENAKLVDFGLAQLSEHATIATRDDALLYGGTPAYMSPEQARGERAIDARADVYGLGASLYEMLTGEPPFRGRPGMILDQVQNDEPRPPRRLDAAIPRDLETICLKAMAKEPARRYQTAAELDLDLDRFLKGAAILARPASHAERLFRWANRNRAIATLGMVAIGLLVALAAGSTVAAVRIDSARRLAVNSGIAAKHSAEQARIAADLADERARTATEQRKLALDAIGALVGQAQAQLKSSPGTLALRRRLAATAMERLKSVAQDKSGGQDVAIARITALNLMGDLAFLAGDTKAAIQNHSLARDQAERLFQSDAPQAIEAGRQLAAALDKLGDLAGFGNMADQAAVNYKRAAEVREGLPDSYKSSVEGRRERAVSAGKIGEIQLRAGDLAAARASFARDLELTEANRRAEPKRRLSDLRYVHTRLGDTALAANDLDEAVSQYDLAAQSAMALSTLDAEDPDGERQLAATEQKLGNAELRRDHPDRALVSYRRALDRFEKIARDDSGNADAQRNLEVGHSLIGDALVAGGDLVAANDAFERACAKSRELAAKDPLSPQKAGDVLFGYSKLADVAERQGRFDLARERMEASKRELEAMVGLGAVAAPLGRTYRGMIEQSIELYREADQRSSGRTDNAHGPIADKAEALVAMKLARQGKRDLAASLARELESRYAKDPEFLYSIARIESLCIDRRSSNADAEATADLAARTLITAAKARPELMTSAFFEPDFAPIRGRPAIAAYRLAAKKASVNGRSGSKP